MKNVLLGILIILLTACGTGTENKAKSATENTVDLGSEGLVIDNQPDSVIEVRNINGFKVTIYTISNDNPNVAEQGIIIYDAEENQVSEMKYVKSFGNEWNSQSSNYVFSGDIMKISFKSEEYHPGAEASDDPSLGVSMEEFLLIDDPYSILDKTILKEWTETYQITKTGRIEKINSEENKNKTEITEFYRFDVLPAERLRILRNSLFANYGYKFKSQDLQDYFAVKPWYKPERENVDSLLTETDKEIISYLKKVEEKAGNKN